MVSPFGPTPAQAVSVEQVNLGFLAGGNDQVRVLAGAEGEGDRAAGPEVMIGGGGRIGVARGEEVARRQRAGAGVDVEPYHRLAQVRRVGAARRTRRGPR